MKVTGIIIRRKSFGKWLAFATLKILSIDNDDASAHVDEDSLQHYDHDGIENVTINDESLQTIRIVFQRDSPFWDEANDEGNGNSTSCAFPIKNSLLPYGAKIKVDLRERTPDDKSGCRNEVCSWELLDDPRSIAYENAKQKGGDTSVSDNPHDNEGQGEVGVYLHEYLKSRGNS